MATSISLTWPGRMARVTSHSQSANMALVQPQNWPFTNTLAIILREGKRRKKDWPARFAGTFTRVWYTKRWHRRSSGFTSNLLPGTGMAIQKAGPASGSVVVGRPGPLLPARHNGRPAKGPSKGSASVLPPGFLLRGPGKPGRRPVYRSRSARLRRVYACRWGGKPPDKGTAHRNSRGFFGGLAGRFPLWSGAGGGFARCVSRGSGPPPPS